MSYLRLGIGIKRVSVAKKMQLNQLSCEEVVAAKSSQFWGRTLWWQGIKGGYGRCMWAICPNRYIERVYGRCLIDKVESWILSYPIREQLMEGLGSVEQQVDLWVVNPCIFGTKGIQGSILEEKKVVIPHSIEQTDRVQLLVAMTSTLRQVEGVIADLAKDVRSNDILGLQMMRISGDSVLLIFIDVVAEETLEPSSFERGRRKDPTQDVPSDQEGEGAVVIVEQEDMVRQVDKNKGVAELVGADPIRCVVAPVETTPILLSVEQSTNWVSVSIEDEVELQNGHALEGSTTKILFRNESKKKEKVQTDRQRRKGKGRTRKAVCRQTTILKEANSTVEFGKLLGVKTIGREEAIVQDIARIIAQSQ
ncbi:hypothetical protein GQ457_16G013040 [Hibiscus cannabinus]